MRFRHSTGLSRSPAALVGRVTPCAPPPGNPRVRRAEDCPPYPFLHRGLPFRKLILVGAVAGLLLAGFNHHARATNFTNGDLITHVQYVWGDPGRGYDAPTLLADNWDTVYASTSGTLEVGNEGANGFVMAFSARWLCSLICLQSERPGHLMPVSLIRPCPLREVLAEMLQRSS